jgi:hypothetical protein
MAILDARVGSTAGKWENTEMVYRLLAIVDFSKTANQMASADTMKIMDIPAGFLIERVRVKIITADTTGNSPTFDLYVDTGTKFLASANPKSTALTYKNGDGSTGTGAASVQYDNITVAPLIMLCNTAAIAVAKMQFEVIGYINAIPASNATVLAN